MKPTLQERLMSESRSKFHQYFRDEIEKQGNKNITLNYDSVLDQIILRTIEQTIKEGCGNRYKMPDGTTPEIVFIGMYKDGQYYQEVLTDTQHALRGIIG